MTKTLKDTLTGKVYHYTIGKNFATEDDMWAHLCDKYGVGYVFENIEEISA